MVVVVLLLTVTLAVALTPEPSLAVIVTVPLPAFLPVITQFLPLYVTVNTFVFDELHFTVWLLAFVGFIPATIVVVSPT